MRFWNWSMSASVPTAVWNVDSAPFSRPMPVSCGSGPRFLGSKAGRDGLPFCSHELIHQAFDIESGPESGCGDRHRI